MGHSTEYMHLDESARDALVEAGALVPYVDFMPMCALHGCTNTPDADGWCPAHKEFDREREEFERETTQFVEERVSPWVKRNNDYAQYAQPRGSQYEG